MCEFGLNRITEDRREEDIPSLLRWFGDRQELRQSPVDERIGILQILLQIDPRGFLQVLFF
jgi:hypothetical protein